MNNENYTKYKSQYIRLKNTLYGGCEIDKTILKHLKYWTIEHWIVFVNCVFIIYDVREMYLFPSNHNIQYSKQVIHDVFKLFIDINFNHNLKYDEGFIYLYNDELLDFVKHFGSIIYNSANILDFNKIGFNTNDKTLINEHYVGLKLGFGECSGETNYENHHVNVYFYDQGLNIMNFFCSNGDVKWFIDKLKLLKENITNKYLQYIFNTSKHVYFKILITNNNDEKIIDV